MLKLTELVPSENEFGATIAKLLAMLVLPPAVWSHFPAGGYLLSKAAQARLYRLGLKPGIPDIIIWHRRLDDQPRCTMIELKRRKGGRLSTAQEEMHPKLRDAGCVVWVCNTVEQVVSAVVISQVPHNESLARAILERHRGNQSTESSRTPELAEGAGQAAA